jgi:hypothetical protein
MGYQGQGKTGLESGIFGGQWETWEWNWHMFFNKETINK